MHARVHDGTEVGVATAAEAADEEPGPQQEAVVVDVEKRYLFIFLPQDHEHRVEELDELVVVVDVDQETELPRARGVVHLGERGASGEGARRKRGGSGEGAAEGRWSEPE